MQRGARVIHETHHDLSLRLRDIVPLYGRRQPEAGTQRVERRGRTGEPYSVPPGERDPALQESDAAAPLSTTNLLNFDGLTAAESGDHLPPDTNGAAGSSQFVQTVNTAYEVFNKKTGHPLMLPLQINGIFAGFGGPCDSGPNFSDPIVLYDKMADRWVISIVGSDNGFMTGLVCIAVSTSSDATSSYNRYSFDFGLSLPDQPKLASWPDGYYLTVDEVSPIKGRLGGTACALDRANMLAGSAATMQCFKSGEAVLYTFMGGEDGRGPTATWSAMRRAIFTEPLSRAEIFPASSLTAAGRYSRSIRAARRRCFTASLGRLMGNSLMEVWCGTQRAIYTAQLSTVAVGRAR
jgi:hypothetical protein